MPDEPEKPELRPAATNPWYVLMTVAGEQTEEFDWGLHARNRQYWNRWQAQALSEEQKRNLIEDGHAIKEDLADLTRDELAEVGRVLAERCPSSVLPNPSDDVNFEQCGFDKRLSCVGFYFAGQLRLSGAKLSSDCDFRGADMFDRAFFNSTEFGAFAWFIRTKFHSFAFFRASLFKYVSVFTRSAFHEDVYFERASFTREVYFEGAQFYKGAAFNDAAFHDATSFTAFRARDKETSLTRFHDAPPSFFNARLHEDTDFTDVIWPPVPKTRERAVQHRRAYERLKLQMDSQKKVADELMFQRLELRCREAEATGGWRSREWWGAGASRLYGALSDYGWDPIRPATYLAWLLLAGWALIFLAEWADYNLGRWDDPASAEYLGFWQSGALSLSNVFGFLGFNRTFLAEEVRTLTAFSEIVSGAQTVFGLILFFLLGLALRNRFRIK